MLLTRLPLGIATPFDLHVLGTPPALVLSQDQTLHNKIMEPFDDGSQTLRFVTKSRDQKWPETHRLLRLLHCSVFKERLRTRGALKRVGRLRWVPSVLWMVRVRPTDPCRSRHDGYHIAAHRACQGKRWYGFLTAPQIGIPVVEPSHWLAGCSDLRALIKSSQAWASDCLLKGGYHVVRSRRLARQRS